jgi:hypothetical protein
MKHLKHFEAVHYGEKHSGQIIKDYFPWYTYTRSLNNLPEVNKLMNDTFRNSLPEDLINVTFLWGDQNNGYYHVIMGRTRSFYQTDSLLIDPQEHEAIVSLYSHHSEGDSYHTRTEHEVDDWDDVEKLRLMHTLGKKSLSEKYWKIKSQILELFEYLQYEIEDNDMDPEDIYISDFKYLMNKEGISPISISNPDNVTDEDVYDFVKNYQGSENFFHSLGSYLQRNNKLTERQIDACRKTVAQGFVKNKMENKIGMVFKNVEPNRPTILRLKNKGYSVLDIEGLMIVYKA